MEEGDLKAVQKLLSGGKDVNKKDRWNRSLLLTAAISGNLKMCRLLLNHGADVNTADNTGATPLFAAAVEGRDKIISLLLERGADLDVKNEDANYGEKFWAEIQKEVSDGEGYIVGKTKKLDFFVGTGMIFDIYKNGELFRNKIKKIEKEKYLANSVSVEVSKNDRVVLHKYGANLSSLDYDEEEVIENAKSILHNVQRIDMLIFLPNMLKPGP